MAAASLVRRPAIHAGPLAAIPRRQEPSSHLQGNKPWPRTSAAPGLVLATRTSAALPDGAPPLQSPASRAAFRPKAGAWKAAAQDSQAAPVRPPPDPLRPGAAVVHVRARHLGGERDPLARSGPAATAGGRRLHLRPQGRARPRRPPGPPEPDPRPVEQDLEPDEARDRRHRGQALLRTPRRRPARDRAGDLAGRPAQEGRRGRLHDHAAVRQERLRKEPTVDRPEAEGGRARLAAGATLVEGQDPDRLPEHDL